MARKEMPPAVSGVILRELKESFFVTSSQKWALHFFELEFKEVGAPLL